MIATASKGTDGSQVHSIVAHTVRSELRPLLDELRKIVAELKDIKKNDKKG